MSLSPTMASCWYLPQRWFICTSNLLISLLQQLFSLRLHTVSSSISPINLSSRLIIFCFMLLRLNVKMLFILLGSLAIFSITELYCPSTLVLSAPAVTRVEDRYFNLRLTFVSCEPYPLLLSKLFYLIFLVSYRRASMYLVFESRGLMIGLLVGLNLDFTFCSQMLAKVCRFLLTKEDLCLLRLFHLLRCSASRIICRQEETLCRNCVACFFFYEFSQVLFMSSSFSSFRNPFLFYIYL